jgi:hypothetical protein
MRGLTLQEIEDRRVGVIGQFAFQSLLQEWRIPYLTDYPLFRFREHRLFVDFIVPGFGSIEVKSFPRYAERFIVKKRLWDATLKTPDYVVAIRVVSDSMCKIEGWLPGSEVAKLPYDPKVCPYEECYQTRFENLRRFRELLPKLLACSIDEEVKKRVSEEFQI